MHPKLKIYFKDLKTHIADSIKQSCYKFDARYYNIANRVLYVSTVEAEPGVENIDGLSKIIHNAVKDAVGVGCDLSVIIKGILLGGFRSHPLAAPATNMTIRVLIKEILEAVFKFRGNIKESLEGIMAAIVIISNSFDLNAQDVIKMSRDYIISSSKEINPKFAADIFEALPTSEEQSPSQ